MNKTEWKKLYHDYRHDRFDFEVYMASKNFPCGYDDMMYENHANVVQDFVDENPVLKQVLEIMDQTDDLEWRAEQLEWYQDSPEHKVKRLAQFITRYREAV